MISIELSEKIDEVLCFKKFWAINLYNRLYCIVKSDGSVSYFSAYLIWSEYSKSYSVHSIGGRGGIGDAIFKLDEDGNQVSIHAANYVGKNFYNKNFRSSFIYSESAIGQFFNIEKDQMDVMINNIEEKTITSFRIPTKNCIAWQTNFSYDNMTFLVYSPQSRQILIIDNPLA